MNKILYIDEPEMMFGANQLATDPRDGLLLFGPYESLKPYSIKAGVIGPERCLDMYKDFVRQLNAPIISTKKVYGKEISDEISRPSFPGFESVFGVEWPCNPEIFIPLDNNEINTIIESQNNKNRRTNDLVDMYLKEILSVTGAEDTDINVWFIIVTKNIFTACKPMSKGSDLGKGTRDYLERSKQGQHSLPFEDNIDYLSKITQLFDTSNDFHNLLKARLIQSRVSAPSQLLLESTLKFRDKYKNKLYSDNLKAHIAWTYSTTLYYKLGKMPWKLYGIRDGVCYLGLVFKKMKQTSNNQLVCSAAQMFLKDGDGAVFRGNIGLWQSKSNKEFHLDTKSANELLSMALDDYYDKWNKYPKEIFVHGKTIFSNMEWDGFNEAVSQRSAKTKLTGVTIKESKIFKMYRDVRGESSRYGVMRGLGVKISDFEGYLFTNGFIPRLNTSSCLEIPNPLHIKINKGRSDIHQVMSDVLALTKLNYNACLYGDGLPVTLRFSDHIGNILTATKEWKTDIRQFKYYI